MKHQLEQRLRSLKAEFESGQQVLAELDEKRNTLRETLLRISGAIQVLEEELTKATDLNGMSTIDRTKGNTYESAESIFQP